MRTLGAWSDLFPLPARTAFRLDGPFLILAGLVAFSPLIEGGTTHLPVLLIRLVLIAALTAWLFGSMKTRQLVVYRNRLFLPVVVFVGWAVLSVFQSPYAAPSLQWLISIFSYAALFFLVLHFVHSLDQVRKLVGAILSMGLFEAALGIYQYLWEGQPRATGTFFNPNFFATYEMTVFMLAFGLLCFWGRAEAARWEKLFLWITACVTVVAFILAQSRGAFVAFVMAVSSVGLYRFGKVFVAVLLLGMLMSVIIPTPLQHRLLTVGRQDPYAFTRLEIWKNSLQRIGDYPWGAGLGMYQYTSFQYRFPIEGAISQYGKRAESAHNEYLQMAVELGVVGAVVFLVGVGLLGQAIWETLRAPLESWERGALTGLAGGILGMLVHAAVDTVFHEPALVLLLVLSSGLVLVLHRLRVPDGASVWTVPFPYHPARVVLVLVLATLLGLLVIRPAVAWYAFDKGGLELAAGRVDRAVSWYQWATRVDPGTSLYHDAMAFALVHLYRQTGEVQWLYKAVPELMIGLELNPLDGRLANRLGKLFVLLAEQTDTSTEREATLEQAATYYEQARQLDPYSPFNYLELGQLRWTQGRVDEAQAWFRRAASYEPNFLPARVRLVELFLQTGHKDVALLEYAAIIKIRKRYQGWTLNGLERQYLEVDLGPLKRALAVADVS